MKCAYMRGAVGFTLIELLVVVLIIGILASVALTKYNRVIHRTRMMAWTPLARAWAQAGAVCSLAKGSACCFDEIVFDFPGLELAPPPASGYHDYELGKGWKLRYNKREAWFQHDYGGTYHLDLFVGPAGGMYFRGNTTHPVGLKMIQSFMGEPTDTNGDWRFFQVFNSAFSMQGQCRN